MVMSRADIQKQLIPGLNRVVGLNYGQVVGDYKVLFDTEKSDRSFEEEVLMTGLGEAPTKQEGESVTYDDASEAWTARYTHATVAMAFAITEEAMEDELYDTYSMMRAKALGRSMGSTKEQRAADVFNNGFTAGSFAIGDGVALFSASHPLVTGGVASNYTNADLSEAALEQAIINISLLEDDRGLLINAMAKSLHIPPHLQFTAFQILKSDLSTTTVTNSTTGVTNVNDINALKAQGFFPGGIHVNRRFTDTDAWFIRTDVPDGFKHFERTPLKMTVDGDFNTGNLRVKARERYSFGVTNWRGGYGADGSAT